MLTIVLLLLAATAAGIGWVFWLIDRDVDPVMIKTANAFLFYRDHGFYPQWALDDPVVMERLNGPFE